MFKIVSIMPGISIYAPDLIDSSNGFYVFPSFFPILLYNI